MKDLEIYTLGFSHSKHGIFEIEFLWCEAYLLGQVEGVVDEFERAVELGLR